MKFHFWSELREKFLKNNQFYWSCLLLWKSLEISMGNIMIYWESFKSLKNPQNKTTCFWGTMLIAEGKELSPFAYCFAIKFSTLKTFFCCEEIMSVPQLPKYMDFMMSAKEDIISIFGKSSPIVSTSYPSLLSLKIRYCVCMEGFLLIWIIFQI